jgi:hypothetical protein
VKVSDTSTKSKEENGNERRKLLNRECGMFRIIGQQVTYNACQQMSCIYFYGQQTFCPLSPSYQALSERRENSRNHLAKSYSCQAGKKISASLKT